MSSILREVQKKFLICTLQIFPEIKRLHSTDASIDICHLSVIRKSHDGYHELETVKETASRHC